jgi:RND family efflux transporter MFP subunit
MVSAKRAREAPADFPRRFTIMARKIVRSLIVLVVVVAIVGGGVALINRKKQAIRAAPQYGMQPTPVRVASARQGDLRTARDYVAVVQPIRVADVSSRVTATVERIWHDEGEWVKARDTLVVLDGRQTEESIAAMKAQVEQAQADLASNQAAVESLVKAAEYWGRQLQRDKTLAERGAAAAVEVERDENEMDQAKGKLDAARHKSAAIEGLIESLKRKQAELETQLSYCTIRSPFDGLVSRRLIDPGDLATPGKSLMVVEDRSRFKLCFDVPQQDLPHVREGLEVDYSATGQARTALLSHLFPSLSAARMLRAEVYLDGPETDGLSSGAYVPLRVVLGNTRDVVLVPACSVVESPDRTPHVFVVRDGHLKGRPVRILGCSGDDVAVEGVQAGEQVVLSTFLGWAQLSVAQKVEPIK